MGERAGRGDLGDLAGAHAHVVAAVDARARIEHVDVAQEHVGRLLRAVDERVGGHHAGWRSPIAAPAASGRPDEGEVEGALAPASSS